MIRRFNPFARVATVALAVLLSYGCVSNPSSAAPSGASRALPTSLTPTVAAPQATTPQADPNTITTYSYSVVNRYPHDTSAWTEGLVYIGNDTFYESTGEYERSSLREVQLATGQISRAVGLGDASFYGEGISPIGDTIFMLTWKNCRGLFFRRSDFSLTGQFSYPQCAMEGWGMTYDGSQLIMSDGTSTLSFIDPAATLSSGQLAIVRQVQVTNQGIPQAMLNELEYINGSIFANVWQPQKDLPQTVVQIDPASGQVIGHLDLSNLLTPTERAAADVLNGIAYDAQGNRLFVTGKYWPALFEIRLQPPISYHQDLPLVSKG
ncbi:MAG: glutaminyl-peptide cyclotransferase [Oscillochloris sp.]|nr:glutaminyl-peptide cyclotransferase [Oscillochloris sp.]